MKNFTVKGFIAAALFIVAAFLVYLGVSACSDTTNKNSGNPEYKQKSRYPKTFTNCIFNSSLNEIYFNWRMSDNLHTAKNLALYKELNFNSIHVYDELGTDIYGRVDTPVLSRDQIERYKNFLDSVKKDGGFYGFFERSYISKYCYGQRLVYEVAPEKGDKSSNYGFVYLDRERGIYENNAGRTVIHASPSKNKSAVDSGYICRNIYENLQQSDLFNFRQNDRGIWHIKPVMKIPAGTPDAKRIVRIEIIPFGSNKPVRNVTIYAGNFKSNNKYSGEYIESYTGLDKQLDISGDTGINDLNYGRPEDWTLWESKCNVDFRVFWYGESELWFDKMIVDDDVAAELFNPTLQPVINARIKQEVDNFTGVGGLYSFFTDEVFFSQYPCIKYVTNKMREYNNNSKISVAITKNADMIGLKNDFLGYGYLLDSIKPDFLQVDHHGFQSWTQPLPSNIEIHDKKIPSSWIAPNNDEYNNILQNSTLGSSEDKRVRKTPGTFLNELVSTQKEIEARTDEIRLIMQPQLQAWIKPDPNTGNYLSGSREPTNEEIQVQSMLSIAHGADGLCWFIYDSRIETANGKPIFYMIGLLNPEDGLTKRTLNAYGQNKWNYVSEMNGKILKWAPILESTSWADGFSVHQNGADNFFVQDIKSLYRNKEGTFDERSNTDKIKYWEEGFFMPKDRSDKSLYVLFVNRRCVPETTPGAGDIRVLKIKFKASELNGSDKWKLTDLSSNSVIIFDKNKQGADGFVSIGNRPGDIGYFNPGEGKLFKLEQIQ